MKGVDSEGRLRGTAVRDGLSPGGTTSSISHPSGPAGGAPSLLPNAAARLHPGGRCGQQAVAVGDSEIRKLRLRVSLLLPSWMMQIFPACLEARSLRAWGGRTHKSEG